MQHYITNNELHKLDINILKQYARNRLLLSYFYLFFKHDVWHKCARRVKLMLCNNK